MAKYIVVEAGSWSVGNKTYRAGVHSMPEDEEQAKRVEAAAKSVSFVKLEDEFPEEAPFSESQVAYLRKMFPDALKPTTAQQKRQLQAEALQQAKVEASGSNEPDDPGILSSEDLKQVESPGTGIPMSFDEAAKARAGVGELEDAKFATGPKERTSAQTADHSIHEDGAPFEGPLEGKDADAEASKASADKAEDEGKSAKASRKSGAKSSDSK